MDRAFQFYAPLTFFEKAGAPPGQTRRIAGIISTEMRDKQQEVVLQRGLDFGPFLKSGWNNDNHSKKTTDVLGYPTEVKRFQKGEQLPDGSSAKANGTWAEGYLLETPEADKVWKLGLALAKAGSDRRLGYSIEGSVLERTGPDRKTVAKAVVRNVALTNCPVGEDTRMEILAKSLDDIEKGLTATPALTPPGVNPSAAGSVSGNAGQILMPQHIEGGETLLKEPKPPDEDDEEGIEKSYAVAVIQARLGCNRPTAERTFGTLHNLKQRGLL
jgi:hypothetical protein